MRLLICVALLASCAGDQVTYVLPSGVTSALVIRAPDKSYREAWPLDRAAHSTLPTIGNDGTSDWNDVLIVHFGVSLETMGARYDVQGRVELTSERDGWPFAPILGGMGFDPSDGGFVELADPGARIAGLRLTPPPCPTLVETLALEPRVSGEIRTLARLERRRFVVGLGELPGEPRAEWAGIAAEDGAVELPGTRLGGRVLALSGPLVLIEDARGTTAHEVGRDGRMRPGRAITGLEGERIVRRTTRPTDGATIVLTSSGSVALLDLQGGRWQRWPSLGISESFDDCRLDTHQAFEGQPDGSVVASTSGTGLVRISATEKVRLFEADPTGPGHACASQYLQLASGAELAWRADGALLGGTKLLLRWRPSRGAPWATVETEERNAEFVAVRGDLALMVEESSSDWYLRVFEPRRADVPPRRCPGAQGLANWFRDAAWDGEELVVSGMIGGPNTRPVLRWLAVRSPM